MENDFLPEIEENNHFLFADIILVNPDTGKYIHRFNWDLPSHHQ